MLYVMGTVAQFSLLAKYIKTRNIHCASPISVCMVVNTVIVTAGDFKP